MSQRFVHFFPLSIYRDQLGLDEASRRSLTELILQMEQDSDGKHESATDESAWLGDEQGHEFLFQRPEFRPLFAGISKCIREYTAALGINNDLIEFYFQRAWATISRQGERINQHAHEQSNISFAYYLSKPAGSGGINFVTENHPNEFSPGIFTPAKQSLGFIQESSPLTWNVVTLDAKEDEIVLFPSKTLHSTVPNETSEPRVSISADVVTLLRDSSGHETMMPHFRHWQSLDEF